MKYLEVVNRYHQPVAEITWESPNHLHLVTQDVNSKAKMETFLYQAQKYGLVLKTGRYVENRNLLVDEWILVKSDDERILEAIADTVNQQRFSSDRLFGLIEHSPD